MARYRLVIKESAAKEIESVGQKQDQELVVSVVKVGDRKDVYKGSA